MKSNNRGKGSDRVSEGGNGVLGKEGRERGSSTRSESSERTGRLEKRVVKK